MILQKDDIYKNYNICYKQYLLYFDVEWYLECRNLNLVRYL